MSPPEKRKLRRWQMPGPRSKRIGSYSGHLADEKIAALFARVCVFWPHLEELMILIFCKLIGTKLEDSASGRLIFTAIINQQTRIAVMRALLEKSDLNKDKGDEFDEIIDEFKKLNELRNKYVHSLWWTHESGDTYIQTENDDWFGFSIEYKRVTAKELSECLVRMHQLAGRIAML